MLAVTEQSKETVNTPCVTAETKVGHQSCSHASDLRTVTTAFSCVTTGMSCHITIPCLISTIDSAELQDLQKIAH